MKMKLNTIAHIIPEKISSYENLLEELGEMQEIFGGGVELVNTETGEVIIMEEISRVRGILTGLLNGSTWKVDTILK